MRAHALVLLVLVAPAAASAGEWEKAAEVDGVAVYSRETEGSDVREMKAYGTIDAAPERVLAVLADVAAYPETMPYTEVSKLLKRTGNQVWFYTVINAPLVDRRDYALRITLSKQADGSYKSQWIPANELAPPLPEDTVRVTLNEGYWLLNPADGGKRTKAVYFVKTDPGGSLPTFVANKANSQAVPDVFAAVRKAVASPRYANAPSPIEEPKPAEPAPAAAPTAPAN